MREDDRLATTGWQRNHRAADAPEPRRRNGGDRLLLIIPQAHRHGCQCRGCHHDPFC
jgi:hypothetical protein